MYRLRIWRDHPDGAYCSTPEYPAVPHVSEAAFKVLAHRDGLTGEWTAAWRVLLDSSVPMLVGLAVLAGDDAVTELMPLFRECQRLANSGKEYRFGVADLVAVEPGLVAA